MGSPAPILKLVIQDQEIKMWENIKSCAKDFKEFVVAHPWEIAAVAAAAAAVTYAICHKNDETIVAINVNGTEAAGL